MTRDETGYVALVFGSMGLTLALAGALAAIIWYAGKTGPHYTCLPTCPSVVLAACAKIQVPICEVEGK